MQPAGFLQLSQSKVFSVGSKEIADPTLADVYVLVQNAIAHRRNLAATDR